jgi:tryptophan halogenase
VTFTDAVIKGIERDNLNGDITYLVSEDGRKFETNFVVDCSGFKKIVFSKIANSDFCSYENYLQCDSAVVFQTPSEDNRIIKPYTNAQAMSAGWMWEIPTQERRGNGYVFSSNFISEDEAIEEAKLISGFESDNYRVIRFNPGYERSTWKHNCVMIGLSSNFIEPLEATSIASSIQQAFMLTSYLAVYEPHLEKLRSEYDRLYTSMMENLCSMICLHYISDRCDTPMWEQQQKMDRPDYLRHLLEIMAIRGLESHDIKHQGFELFGSPHFWHVAQGQNQINRDGCIKGLNARHATRKATSVLSAVAQENKKFDYIPHRDALERGATNACAI